MKGIEWIQYILNFECCTNPQFTSSQGLGRVGLIGITLGLFAGFHLCCVILLAALSVFNDQEDVKDLLIFQTSPWILLLWCTYILFLSLFHIGEFLFTAIYNPNVVNADSFVVNHSSTYTTAVLLSFLEFWLETALAPSIKENYKILNAIGLVLVIGGSSCRLVAMATCGPNFHHKIQVEQTIGHKLVTHGMYVCCCLLVGFVFAHHPMAFSSLFLLFIFDFVTFFCLVCHHPYFSLKIKDIDIYVIHHMSDGFIGR